MLARLPAGAEAVADGAAGWAALPGAGAAARGLGALAARCVGGVGSDRPPMAQVCTMRGGGEAVVCVCEIDTVT